MAFIKFIFNTIFFSCISFAFYRSSKIPKCIRLVFSILFGLLVIFIIAYYLYGLLSGTNKYILYWFVNNSKITNNSHYFN